MLGATNLTHISNPAVAPLYLDTTFRANTAVINNHTEIEDEYDEESDCKKGQNSVLMGVVATQHIREEYEQDQGYGEEDDEYDGIQMIAENEGGGQSNVESRRGGYQRPSY